MAQLRQQAITLTSGDKFTGGTNLQFTVITDAVISDGEGNVFGSYTSGASYEGSFPQSTFIITSGSIKLWAK